MTRSRRRKHGGPVLEALQVVDSRLQSIEDNASRRSPSTSTSDTFAQSASQYPPLIGAIALSSEISTTRAAPGTTVVAARTVPSKVSRYGSQHADNISGSRSWWQRWAKTPSGSCGVRCETNIVLWHAPQEISALPRCTPHAPAPSPPGARTVCASPHLRAVRQVCVRRQALQCLSPSMNTRGNSTSWRKSVSPVTAHSVWANTVQHMESRLSFTWCPFQ